MRVCLGSKRLHRNRNWGEIPEGLPGTVSLVAMSDLPNKPVLPTAPPVANETAVQPVRRQTGKSFGSAQRAMPNDEQNAGRDQRATSSGVGGERRQTEDEHRATKSRNRQWAVGSGQWAVGSGRRVRTGQHRRTGNGS